VALQVGDTNILATDAKGNLIARINIHVRYDVSAIQNMVDELFPDEQVEVGSLHDQIFLKGIVSTPQAAANVANVVGHYVSDLQDQEGTVDELIANLLKVRGEQQVMLRVKIVEASRRILKELGVETNINDLNELSTATIFGNPPVESVEFGDSSGLARTLSNFGLSEDPAFVGRLLGETGIRGLGLMEVLLKALEENNLVNVLAEPNLTAVSGEQAGFLAGGEFPVPRGRDNYGNIVIEMQQFGVSLNFRPTVLSGERISLLMDTEVSSLNYENAIVLSEVTVPGLDVRRASTTVELPSGGSLMIAGLLRSDNLEGMNGIPGLIDTPVLGELVKSRNFQRDETELVVIVTPYLVEPYEEKEYAEVVEEEKTRPLTEAFVTNIRRTYGDKAPDFMEEEGAFGYLLN
jgi:pilus assembly protein CpaC